MTKELTTILQTAQRDELAKILNGGLVAIVENKSGVFQGLITRIDFINHLRSESSIQKGEMVLI